uniref:Nei-like DNA glycosylase 1 n=1 Tax=Alvinella pompejana TaxID=6376 RepID=A0A7U3NR40_9ANNE|nr:nei-like DNA glycosylase 1 [Alvinella pompejana]
MPEGPELFIASRFVNAICKGRYFSGIVKKSDVSKCPSVMWDSDLYTIAAASRGKEIKLTLTDVEANNTPGIKGNHKKQARRLSKEAKKLDIVFTFGMSGKFTFNPVNGTPKHAHLQFFTKDDNMSLCFVDTRRFGKWVPEGDWSPQRGPCVILEYEQFRENVLSSLKLSEFDKPICEVMLNQKYFNGVGNYLRAEVLYRAGVRPFEKARNVLEQLNTDGKMKSESPDILSLCHSVAREVVDLAKEHGSAYYNEDEDTTFMSWLQCYYNPNMKSISDHNGRTIWFAGDPGPLVPKDAKKMHQGKSRKSVPKKSASESVAKVDLLSANSQISEDQDTLKEMKSRSNTKKARNDIVDDDVSSDKKRLQLQLSSKQKVENVASRTRSKIKQKLT